VTERIPAGRTTLDFAVRRKFRESRTYVQVLVRNSRRPRWTAAALMLRGAVQAGIWALPRLAAGFLPERDAARARLGFAAGTGKLFWHAALHPGDPLYN
jgi:hypothetical protein